VGYMVLECCCSLTMQPKHEESARERQLGGIRSGAMKGLVVLTGLGIALFGLRLTAQPAVSGDVPQAMQEGAQAMAAGQFSQAVEDYSAVTRSRPDFAGGFLNLGLAQMQAGELDKAR